MPSIWPRSSSCSSQARKEGKAIVPDRLFGGSENGTAVRTDARRRLLLHVCCGPCATHSILTLREEYDLTLFFSNSNIAPFEEYERRRDTALKLSALCDVPLVCDAYEHEAWLAGVVGLENEPEGGRRCERCFAFNLSRAAGYARTHGFDLFTTTLTISPHKKSETIFRIGAAAGPFLKANLKKRGGFERSVELSARHNLYRQTYCGCEFSHAARR